MTLRVGMIGTGWMGRAIAPDFALTEGVELVAVGARDRERTTAFAAEFGIPRALTTEELLADDDVDLVYVATTHEGHFPLTRAALEQGKPVLVEKAFTLDAAEAQELIGLAHDRGLFLMEAMWMRFNPAIRRIQELVASGAIGEPRTVHASFGVPFPVQGRLWDPLKAGGSLLDQGVYPMAFAQLVLGDPTTVVATGSRLGYDGTDAGVDTELGMLLGYAGGQQALLSSSIRALLPLTASIGGSEGRIEVEQAFWSTEGFSILRPDQTSEHVAIPKEGNGYVPMLRAVAEAVEAGWTEHPLSSHADTLSVMRTADAVAAQIAAL